MSNDKEYFKEKILIIDENQEIVQALQRLLPEFSIKGYRDEEMALRELQKNSKDYCLVLWDINIIKDLCPITKEISKKKIDNFKMIKEIDEELPILFMTAIPRWGDYEYVFKKVQEMGWNILHKVEDMVLLEDGKIKFREMIFDEIKKRVAKKSILVVDDEESVHKGIKLLVPEFAITSAYSVDDALKKLEKRTYDVVILDMKMCPKSGIELIPILQENFPYLSVIVNTGYPDTFGERDILERIKGFNYYSYITKAEDPLKLRNIILDAYELHNNFKTKIKEKLRNTFLEEKTCPFTILFDAEKYEARDANELPEKKQETINFITQNVMSFCKISQLIKKMIEDKEKRPCPCLITTEESRYYLKGYSILSYLCSYYQNSNSEILKIFK